MKTLLCKIWRAAWTNGPRTRQAEVDVDAAIDGADPADVRALAQYLYAMCSGRVGESRVDFALAAVIWLYYGELHLPPRSTPLADDGKAGLPLPYPNRIPL